MLPHRALMRKPWGAACANKTRSSRVMQHSSRVMS